MQKIYEEQAKKKTLYEEMVKQYEMKEVMRMEIEVAEKKELEKLNQYQSRLDQRDKAQKLELAKK